MKKTSLNYYQTIVFITLITGKNPLSGELIKDSSGNPKGLLNEDIPQGVKLRLNRILKNTFELFKNYEESRKELVIKYKGDKEALEPGSESFEKFREEFSQVANEVFELEIDTVALEKIENLSSEIDYTSLLEIICETV